MPASCQRVCPVLLVLAVFPATNLLVDAAASGHQDKQATAPIAAPDPALRRSEAAQLAIANNQYHDPTTGLTQDDRETSSISIGDFRRRDYRHRGNSTPLE